VNSKIIDAVEAQHAASETGKMQVNIDEQRRSSDVAATNKRAYSKGLQPHVACNILLHKMLFVCNRNVFFLK
jgi:hypothetical protein